jgi:hypothetical protein
VEDFYPYDLLGFGNLARVDRQDHAKGQETLSM